MEGLLVSVSCFLMISSKKSSMSNIECDSTGDSNLPFHNGTGILNLLLLYDFLKNFYTKI